MERKRLRWALAVLAVILAMTATGWANQVPELPAKDWLEDWSPPPSRETTLRVTAPDGVELAGVLVLPDRKKPPEAGFPLALLVHSFGRTRDGMLPLADQLAHAGVASVVMDIRGHGSSRGRTDGGAYVFQSAPNRVLKQAVLDLVIVVKQLSRRPEVDGDRVAVVGVGEGGQIAARLAARSRDIDGVAVVDPARQNLAIDMERELELVGARPALLICSGYPASQRWVRQLGEAGEGERRVRCVDVFVEEERLLGYAQAATEEVVTWLADLW